MPMRQDCKQFESRSYPNGDTVRKCNLNLAPEAPWRCPADCGSYEPRLADVNWSHGSLVTPPAPAEPASLEDGDSVAALLEEASGIVNSAGPSMLAEVEAERLAAESKAQRKLANRVKRLFGKRPWRRKNR